MGSLHGFGHGSHGFGWLQGFAQGSAQGLGWLQGFGHELQPARAKLPTIRAISSAYRNLVISRLLLRTLPLDGPCRRGSRESLLASNAQPPRDMVGKGGRFAKSEGTGEGGGNRAYSAGFYVTDVFRAVYGDGLVTLDAPRGGAGGGRSRGRWAPNKTKKETRSGVIRCAPLGTPGPHVLVGRAVEMGSRVPC